MLNETWINKYLLNCSNYCTTLIEQYDIFDEIIECLEQKQFKQYSATAEKNGIAYEKAESHFGAKWNLQLLLR